MVFMPVVMAAQLFDQWIGRLQARDLFGRKQRGQPLLPELMRSLDLALGLRRGRVVQAQRLPRLRETDARE